MRRTDYFPPGGYHSLPDVIMAMEDLSAAAKLVWMALAKFLTTKSGKPCPSVKVLMEATGLARTRVMLSTAELERHGLCRIERGKGYRGSNIYHLLQPQAALFTSDNQKRDRSQGATSRRARPVARRGATSRKARPIVVTAVVDRLTPQPPKGGVGAAAANGSTDTATPDLAHRRVEAAEAVERAYAEHFRSPPTKAFREALARELDAGDATAMAATAEFLAQATKADMRAAVKAAADRKPSPGRFGWKWFTGALRDRLAAAAAKAEADERDRQRRQAEAEERRRQADEAEARKRHWDGLSDAERERYRDEARRKYGGSAAAVFMIGTPQRLDSAAEQLAWQEHKAGGPREAVA